MGAGDGGLDAGRGRLLVLLLRDGLGFGGGRRGRLGGGRLLGDGLGLSLRGRGGLLGGRGRLRGRRGVGDGLGLL